MAGLGLVSPGVKVKEVDLTRGGITGVSDQTGAIAGPFVKGPVEDPQLIESEKDLVETFGKPDSNTFEYFFSAASFLQYSNSLRVVRATNTGLLNATANGSGLLVKNTTHYQDNYSQARQL